jgi:hypothetical protein
MENLKENTLKKIKMVMSQKTESLAICHYYNEEWQENAYLMYQAKRDVDITDFIVVASKKLIELNFLLADDVVSGKIIDEGLFADFDHRKFTESEEVRKLTVSDDICEELATSCTGYKIIDTWDTKLYFIEAEHMFFCYAWETTA